MQGNYNDPSGFKNASVPGSANPSTPVGTVPSAPVNTSMGFASSMQTSTIGNDDAHREPKKARHRLSFAAIGTIIGLILQFGLVMGFIAYASDATNASNDEIGTSLPDSPDASDKASLADYFGTSATNENIEAGEDEQEQIRELLHEYPQLTGDEKKALADEIAKRKADEEAKAKAAEEAARAAEQQQQEAVAVGGGGGNGGGGGQSAPPPAPAPDPVPAAPASTDGSTSGPGFSIPGVKTANFNDGAAKKKDKCAVDFSNINAGYIGARCSQGGKVKLQIVHGNMSYNYDIPSNGNITFVPVNMGNGRYRARFMLNTSGNNYVELFSAEGDAGLPSDLVPYTTPNLFCSYSPSSACVAKARELAGGCRNQGDVVRSVYRWIQHNVTYDYGKASRLANATGYIPNPDATLSARSGICFDYASLAAAMFRSLGIPCKVMTGYVSPGNLYHSWNMIYINGEWIAADISVGANRWNRIDITFAAAGSVGSGYTDRYTY